MPIPKVRSEKINPVAGRVNGDHTGITPVCFFREL